MSVSSSSATLKTDAIGVAVAALATALAAAVIVGTTLLSGVASPQQQAAQLKNIQQESAALDREVDSSRKHLADLTARSERSVRLVPPNQINQRLSEITTLAADAHINIATMTPAQPATSSDAKSTTIAIKLTGASSYPDLTKFLHTLHDRFRDTALNALNTTAAPFSPPTPTTASKSSSYSSSSSSSASSSSSSDNSPKASFTADLTWYCAPPGSAASTASADAPAKP